MYNSAAGLTFAYSTATGTGVAISAFTNANPGVATVGSGSVSSGDYFVFTAEGWGSIEETIRRASAVAAGTGVTVEGQDTTNTTRFPAGAGTGTLRVLNGTGWTPINGIIGISISGDEQSYETLTPYDKSGKQVQIPTTRSPLTVSLTFSHNATAQAWYSALKSLDENGTKAAFRVVYPDGMRALIWGLASLSEGPVQEEMNNPKGKITINGFRTLYGS